MTPMVVFSMCWAALIVAGDTRIGRSLHAVMVQLPAVAANRLTRGGVAIAIAVLLLIVLHVTAEDGDRIRMAGLAVPDLTIWLTTFEVGTIAETTAVLAVAWRAIRRVSVSAVLAILPFRSAAPSRGDARRARRNRRRSCSSSVNDDEDGAGSSLAA